MVRRHSKEDKLTFDAPIEQRTLVPWKQLANSPSISPDNAHRKSKYVFEFLEDPPGKDGHPSGQKTSSSIRESEPNGTPSTPAADEQQQDIQEETQHSKSREVSPIHEKLLLEQNWQKNLIQIDELLSDYSAPNKGEFNQAIFLTTFRNKDVLKLFFKLFDWDNLGHVPQEKIVDCSRRTFLEQGGLEFVELLEVVIYVICQERDVTETCFFKIFNSRGIIEKFFKYIREAVGESGTVTRQMIMDLIANLTYARPRETFSVENLERLEKLFKAALGTKQELSFEDFKKIVHSRNSFFAERVFHIFDRDKSGTVSLSEFIDAMHQFTGKSADDKIKFLFRVYDLDGDGLIQLEELEQVMKACMEENGMKFSNEQIEDLTIALFEDADTEQTGAITCDALKAQLEKHPGLLENLSVSIDRWLIPPPPEIKKSSKLDKLKQQFHQYFSLSYLKNNYVYLLFLLFFAAVNAGLFIDRALTIYYQGHNTLYILARASGQCLNFNCTFILILILRNSLTFLRSHGAAAFLPLDQHLAFHKMCGWVVFFHSSLHTLMHLINFPLNVVHSEVLNPRGLTAAQWLLTDEPGAFGLVEGWANPTGIILMVILIVMVICSLPFVRKSGYFEVFYWTHLLYIAFWVLTILHGPHFYKWFVGPAFIFIIEKLYRVFKTKTQKGKTYISSGILLPSKVIHLVIQKPQGFSYHPGDYVFVNIPAIAKYEWHPFTISSAPEKDGAIWLHIRAVGEWTNRLYSYFENQQIECEKRTSVGKLSIKYSKSKAVAINIDETTLDKKNSVTKFVNKVSEYGSNSMRKEGHVNASYKDNLQEDPFQSSEHTDGGRNSRVKSSLLNVERTDPTDMEISPLQRSAMMSIRYMRRKPPVVNLDLPESEDEGESEEEGHSPSEDLEAGPKSTAVRRASGQIFDRLREGGGAKTNRKKSRQEARRISRLKEAEEHGLCTLGKPLVIYIDGPYGTPSSHIFRAQHAVLIGTGIGVTPFASILQSIMHRYLKARQTCPRCDYSWTGEIPQSVMNLRKVDFFWINRDQRSFEWFVNLLSQLEIEQAEQGGFLERFLDMNMYITSALQKTDMKAVGLQLALDLLHEKEKRDLITGLKTRTNAGRPNWDKVFKQLANQKKGKVTVFYCGPPALGRILRYKCIEYGFEFRKEIF